MENLKTNPVAFSAQNKLLLVVLAILVVIFFLAFPQIQFPRLFSFFFGNKPLNGSELTIVYLSSWTEQQDLFAGIQCLAIKQQQGLFIGIQCLAIIFLPILSVLTLFRWKKTSLIFAYIATFAHIVLGITFSNLAREEYESSTVNRVLSEGLGINPENTLVYGWWLTLIVAIAWCVVFTLLKRKEDNCRV